MKRYIAEGLEQYLNNVHAPWHMPGHKRRGELLVQGHMPEEGVRIGQILRGAMAVDVTEVPGTDDLYCPQEFIADSLAQLREIYQSGASYYLVNGATCGILAAIAACADCGDKILVARNCHKSVYNAVALLRLNPCYIQPVSRLSDKNMPEVCGYIDAEEVALMCRANPDLKVMVITSPTYEGVVSDIEAISKIARQYGVRLIVDEAHGAHLPFMRTLPVSALYCGADVVVQSVHKTLLSLTQTALLHVMDMALDERIQYFLSVFMSSSPSYLFLCSMEEAVLWAYEKDYTEYLGALDMFRDAAGQLRHVHIVSPQDVRAAGAYDCDITRIVLWAEQGAKRLSGHVLEQRLAEAGGIICEMSGIDYVVLISTAADGAEDFEQLLDTLKQLDDDLTGEAGADNADDMNDMNVADNADSAREADYTELRGLIGTRARDNIYVYPPGSYILTKGEEITETALERIISYMRAGKEIRGTLR